MMRIKSITIEGMHNVAEKTYEFGMMGYLFGKNGAGKSTALQAIQLALLGYIPGQNKTNVAIFRHAKNRTITVTLNIDNDGELITVIRTWVNTSGSTVSSSVSITPEGYTTESLIGDLELPIFNFNQFATMTANQLKDWFIGFLPSVDDDIDWNAKLTEAIGDMKLIDENLIADTVKIIEAGPGKVYSGVDLVRAVNAELKNQVTFKKGELDRIQSTIQSLIFHEGVNTDVDVDSLRAQVAGLNQLNVELAAYNAQVAATASTRDALNAMNVVAETAEADPDYIAALKEIEECAHNAATLRQEAEEIKGEVAQMRKEETATLDGATKFMQEWQELSAKRTQIEADIRAESKVIEGGGICPYTTSACDSIKSMIDNINEEIATMTEEMNSINAKIVELKQSYDSQVKVVNDKHSAGDARLAEAHAKLDAAYDADAKAARAKARCNDIVSKYARRDELKSQLDAATTQPVPPTSKTSEELLAEVKQIQDEIVKIEANKKYNELADKLTADKFKIESTLEALKIWIKLTDANGMQTTMMAGPFDALAEDMDKYLHIMFGTDGVSTHFHLSEKANSFSFGLKKASEGGKYVPYDLLSSGEKCLYALAMMLCITAKSSSPLKVVLIDDILDHLDNSNAKAMFESLYNVQDIQFILAGVKECTFDNAPEIIIEVK